MTVEIISRSVSTKTELVFATPAFAVRRATNYAMGPGDLKLNQLSNTLFSNLQRLACGVF